MAEEDRANDDARKDAEEMHSKLDKLADSMTKLADAMGSMSKRMDSVEDRMDKHRDDAARDDKARKDEEEKERKEREDAARRDAQCRDDARHYSRRDADEKDDSYRKRHDDEEESLRKKLEEEGEAKEVAADRAKRARKDAEDCEEKDRKDAARDDKHRDDRARDDRHRDDAHRRDDSVAAAEVAKIMEEVKRLRSMVAPRADADRAALASAQARADASYLMFGEQAPPAMAGETVPDYRRRLAKGLQKYSQHWKSVDLGSTAFADDNVFEPVETQIYNDAQAAAKSAVDVPAGTLRMMERRADGHTIREFVGNPGAWMSQFAGPRWRATSDWNSNLGGKK